MSLMAALVASVLALSLTVTLNLLAFQPDTTLLVEETRLGFDTGALPARHTIAPDRRIGAFTFNDCLILTMAIENGSTALQKAISPSRLRSKEWSSIDDDACAVLYDVVVRGNQANYDPAPYQRYISGPVAPAALLVPHLGVDGYRSLLRAANYALCCMFLAAALWTFAHAPAGSAVVRRKMLAGVIVFGMFLMFSGMEFYAQNLSIGLADPVVYTLFAILLFLRPIEMSRMCLIAISAAAFATIAVFEYWTGQIPVAIAGGIGLIALDVENTWDQRRAWMRIADFAVTGITTIVVIFSLKLGMASVVFHEDVLSGFLRQLGVRAGGVDFGIGNLVLHLGGRLAYVGQGSLALGLLNAVASLLAGWLGLRMVLTCSRSGSVARSIAAALLLSVGSLIAWHLIFRNQSTIHAFFMVRTFAWAAAAAWILLLVGLEARRSALPGP